MMTNKKLLGIGVIVAAVLLIGAVTALAWPRAAEARYGEDNGRAATWSGRGNRGRQATGAEKNAQSPQGDQYDAIGGDLSESEIEALTMALDDEYKAWSVYDQVIADFGAVRPFTSIQKAEENHIAALVTLFDRYGLAVPANEWPGDVPSFGSLADACAAGVQAEVDNAALYDQLFDMVDNPDIVRVFTSLQRASETKHLPAFESCAP